MSYSHLSPLFFNWISRNHSLSIHISSQLWMLKNAINISDCIYSKFLRLYLFQKNIDIKRVRAYYSKRDIESWQLTGCRSSYKYISRSMDPVIGQLPSNSIFMEQDHHPKSDLLWQSTRDLFYIYIYISLRHFSLFFMLSWSLSLPLSPPSAHAFTGVLDLLPQIQDRWFVFPLFPNPLPVVKSLYLLSGIEWILVARSKTNVWRERADMSV